MTTVIIFLLFMGASVGGWSKAQWGMTDAQILEAFAGQATAQTGPLAERNLLTAGIANVGIDSIQIGHTAYRVYFPMDPKTRTLQSIHLKPCHPEDVADVEFLNLEALLEQKYGRPFHTVSPELRSSQWTLPDTIITLRFANVREIHFQSLWLVYQHRAKLEEFPPLD